jgi:hypothetical protein
MPSFRLCTFLIASLALTAPAHAETQIFIVDGSDGYGINRCLLAGERCGEAAATALCRARQFASAVNFGRLDPTEVTGGAPNGAQLVRCEGARCAETVAITCSR